MTTIEERLITARNSLAVASVNVYELTSDIKLNRGTNLLVSEINSIFAIEKQIEKYTERLDNIIMRSENRAFDRRFK
jgi:hypothetical protein